MSRVLDATARLGATPLEKSRRQPTPADAVRSLLAKNGEDAKAAGAHAAARLNAAFGTEGMLANFGLP